MSEDERYKSLDDPGIGDTTGMTEDEQLRKWKQKSHIQNEEIKKLRAKNNQKRNDLKQIGDDVEGLVQQNLRKQALQSSKTNNDYLTELRIIGEIQSGKGINEFTKFVDKGILEKLLELQKFEKMNNDEKQKLEQFNAKSSNLKFTQQLEDLKNELKDLKKKDIEYDRSIKELNKILKEVELSRDKQTLPLKFKENIQKLKDDKKLFAAKLKLLVQKDLEMQKKMKEQQNIFVQLQSKYRTKCKKEGQLPDEKFLIVKEQDKDKKDKNIQDIIQKQRDERQVDIEQKKIEKEERKKKFQENEKNKEKIFSEENFKQVIEKAENLRTQLKEEKQIFQKRREDLQKELTIYQQQQINLQKQFKEADHNAFIWVNKLTEAQRLLALQKEKERKDVKDKLAKTVPQSAPDQEIVTIKKVQEKKTYIHGITAVNESSVQFDDSKQLEWVQDYRLKKITIFFEKGSLLLIGVSTEYTDKDEGFKQEFFHIDGQLFSSIDKEAQKKELEIEADDKISYVSGTYNSSQIIFLKIETAKKQFLQVGNLGYKDQSTKEFRIDIKGDDVITGFQGILDLTDESEEPSQKYLVAFGLKLKPKELDIKGKKQKKQEQKVQEQIKKPIRKIVKYNIKKQRFDNLELIKSQPRLETSFQNLDESARQQHYDQFLQKEKIRQYKARLGLNDEKNFSPATYKEKNYIIDEMKRKEKEKERKKKVEDFRQQTQSAKNLLDPKQQSPPKQQKKQESPPKKQEQKKAEPPKKDQAKKK
ncbi:hypothetical protein pb186bvf_013302 [Paramecium bursaria]